ncbi:MAG: 50S ribosomal protein L23 [Bacillota bacterium]|jgi:large subunit ribosomal protein L23
MRSPYDVLVKPMISEKTIELMENDKYTFFVAKDANKIEIKKAVEEIFNVTVVDVNTRNQKGKYKRMGRFFGKRPDTKKAIVTLKAGDKIEVFSGL